jgi:hypothetical protein
MFLRIIVTVIAKQVTVTIEHTEARKESVTSREVLFPIKYIKTTIRFFSVERQTLDH